MTTRNDKYTIVAIQHYYNANDRIMYEYANEQYPQDGLREYDTVADAAAEIADRESHIYHLAHNESGRPTLLIVEIINAEYIQSGRNGDGGNYDWDGCDCTSDNGECCGSCDTCCRHMVAQDIEWLTDIAVEA